MKGTLAVQRSSGRIAAIVAAADDYKDTWLKLQDGAKTQPEKWADIAHMHAARLRLFDLLGGRKVTLNRDMTDPVGWWCKCGKQHSWGIGMCPGDRAEVTP